MGTRRSRPEAAGGENTSTVPSGRRPRGHIGTLASGALRVRVYAGVDVVSGRDLYLTESIPAGRSARRQAEAARERLIRQVDEKRHPRTTASVSHLLEEHLKVSQVEPRTMRTLQGYVRKHVEPLIGDTPIGRVDALALDRFYAELRRCRHHCDGQPVLHHTTGEHRCDRRCRRHTCTGLAAWTIRKIHYLLNAAYHNAVRWKWIAVNPMEQACKPAPPAPDPQPPTPEEAAALLAECWRWDLGPLVWLAMTTGARRGELCALRWRNLLVRHTDLAAHEDCLAAGCQWWLVIRRAIGESDGQWWETDTKTHQRRHVALDPATVAVLLEHRRRLERDAAALGVTVLAEHYMFPATPHGLEPWRPSSVSQRYSRCARRLGITTSIKCLRHYSATELITAGVDIRTVAGRLGHAGGGTTTLKYYAAWVAAADQQASTVLMSRVPQRPPAVRAVGADLATEQVAFNARLTHERIAATLYERWQAGTLVPGTVLKVKALAMEHGIAVGTAHSTIARLAELGVVAVRTGRPTVVLGRQAAPALGSAPEAVTNPAHAATEPETAPAVTEPSALTLDLLHLGQPVRTMRTIADPEDFVTLHRLLVDSVHRLGGDTSRIGEYELVVRLAGEPEPYTTVVAA